MKKTLFLMMMLGLVTTACQQDNDSQNDSSNDRTVSFHPSLGAMTRATETAFEQGDEISVYAVEGNGVLKAADNYADNVRYRYDGTAFTAVQTGIAVGSDALAYYAVYPYSATNGSTMTFSVKGDQSSHANLTASDLCTAYAAPTTETNVALKFSHRMSRVIVRLTGNDLANKAISLKLKNVQTQATANLNANTFEGTGAAGEVAMGLHSTNAYEAIIAPQSVAAGTEFLTITIDGQEKVLTLENAATYASGRETSYEVEIKDDNTIVVLSGDINPWGTEEPTPTPQPGEGKLMESDKALEVRLMGCERVGGVLVIDYTIKNVSGQDMKNLDLSLEGDAVDDLNNHYNNDWYGSYYQAVGESEYTHGSRTIQLLKSGAVKDAHIKLLGFDPSDKAEYVTANVKVKSDNYTFENNVISFFTIDITDNRLKYGGIQTNDRKLKYTVTSCRVDESTLYLDYKVENLMDEQLMEFKVKAEAMRDDADNDYSSDWYGPYRCSLNGSEYTNEDIVANIPAHGSITGTLRATEFNANAKNVTATLKCSAKNHILDDETLRFIEVVIQK